MALLFDGTDDSVDHGIVFDGPAALTVAFWHYYVTAVASDRFMGKLGTGTVSGWVINNRLASDKFTADVGSTRSASPPAASLPTATWNHWAFVFDGAGSANADKAKWYKNGSLQTSTYEGTWPTTIPTGDGVGNDSFHVGAYDTLSNFTNSRFAHLKIWTTALTAEQVAQEVESRRPHVSTNLVLWAPYDVDAQDYSGAGHGGTISGATTADGPPVGYGALVLAL